MDKPRKYHPAWWRIALLVYPLWLAISLIGFFTDPTVGAGGLTALVLIGAALVCGISMIALLVSVSVDARGLSIQTARIRTQNAAWNSMLAVKPFRFLHIRYARLTLDGGQLPVTFMLSVLQYNAFREDVIRHAPIGNPLRAYLERGELVVRPSQPIQPAGLEMGSQETAPMAAQPSGKGANLSAPALERAIKSGANWFYWIAGLSLLNMLISLFGSTWNFVVGLAATQLVEGFFQGLMQAMNSSLGGVFIFVAVALNLCIAGVFVVLGVLAGKKHGWAFVTGLVLYALDAVLMLLFKDILAFAFHALALFFIFTGYSSLRRLKAAQAGVSKPVSL